MARTYLLCLPQIVKSRRFFQVRSESSEIKHFYRFCSRSKHDKHTLQGVFFFFYCLQSTTNNDQFRLYTQDLWSCFIKHSGHKVQNSRQPQTRIMKGEL